MNICQSEGSNCQCIPEKLIRSIVRQNKQVHELNFQSFQIIHTKNLKYAKDIISLNISQNMISDLQDIAEIINLRYLNISFNKIQSLTALKKLVSLQELRASSNLIEDLREQSLQNNPDLILLDLSYNRIQNVENISQTLIKLNRLNSLNLIGNAIKDYQQYLITNCESIHIIDGAQYRQDEVSKISEKNQIICIQEKQLQSKLGVDQLLNQWRKEVYKQLIAKKNQVLMVKQNLYNVRDLFLKQISLSAKQSMNELNNLYSRLINKINILGKKTALIRKKDQHFRNLLLKLYASLKNICLEEITLNVTNQDKLQDGQILLDIIKRIKIDQDSARKQNKQFQTFLEIEKQETQFLKEQIKDNEQRYVQSKEESQSIEKVYQMQECEKNKQIFSLQCQIKQIQEEKLQILRTQKDHENNEDLNIFTLKQNYEQEIMQQKQDYDLLSHKYQNQSEELKIRLNKQQQKYDEMMQEKERQYQQINEENKQEFRLQIENRNLMEEKQSKEILLLKGQFKENQLQNQNRIQQLVDECKEMDQENQFLKRELMTQTEKHKNQMSQLKEELQNVFEREISASLDKLTQEFEKEKYEIIAVLQNQNTAQIQEYESTLNEEKRNSKQFQLQNMDLMKIIKLKDEIIKQQQTNIQLQNTDKLKTQNMITEEVSKEQIQLKQAQQLNTQNLLTEENLNKQKVVQYQKQRNNNSPKQILDDQSNFQSSFKQRKNSFENSFEQVPHIQKKSNLNKVQVVKRAEQLEQLVTQLFEDDMD